MKTFPQPLPAKEEQFYLQKLKEGDLEARNTLVEHNLRLVAHIVKKYQGLMGVFQYNIIDLILLLLKI